jgi:hypothetical protein
MRRGSPIAVRRFLSRTTSRSAEEDLFLRESHRQPRSGEGTRGAPIAAPWVTLRAGSIHTSNRPALDELSYSVLPGALRLGDAASRAARPPKTRHVSRRGGVGRTAPAVRKDWPCREHAASRLRCSRSVATSRLVTYVTAIACANLVRQSCTDPWKIAPRRHRAQRASQQYRPRCTRHAPG